MVQAIVPGDYIKVSVTGVTEGGWPQVALFGQYGGWPPFTNEGVGGKPSYPYVASFPVTNDLYTSISAEGLSVSGNGAYVSKVEVESSGVEVGPNTVWFGNKACGWGSGVSLPASLFENVKAGDKLMFWTSDQGYQVLLGGWEGLNLPCYADDLFNVSYENGVATYTMIEEYATPNEYEQNGEMKELDVFALMKENGVVMHGTTTLTRIDYIPAPDPISTSVGHATRCGWTGLNFAPAEDITVESYDGYVILKNWSGAQYYDLKVAFDENAEVTSVEGLYDYVDYTNNTYLNYDPRMQGVWTGSDEYYYAYVYLDGYSWAADNNGNRYVCLYCYGYYDENSEDGQFFYYYIQWPLTAEELTEQITAAYDADVATVQEWTDALAQLEEEYPFFSNVEDLDAAFAEIAQDIQSNYELVAKALEAANHDWAYESPFTGAIVSVMNEKILAAMADCEEILKAINEGYEADLAKIEAYKAELDGLTAGVELSDESAKIAVAIKDTLEELECLVNQARALAVNETGVYVSPLNEEAIATVDSMFETFKTTGISAIEAEAEGAIYFGISGQQIQKPAAGQTVIKVINGAASKVMVK